LRRRDCRLMPPPSDPRPFPTVLAQKRQRLGTALQEMAEDLANERRRNRELERELARLRPRVDPAGAERPGPR
jgi:hypothetical protein